MARIYIRTTGNNTTGDGSSINPFLTGFRALQSASTGDILDYGVGTFNENTLMEVPTGISIEGAGKTQTFIQSTITNNYGPIIKLASPSVNTNGNQHISGIGFNGQSLLTKMAFLVLARNNVSVYDCDFIDFYFAAGWFGGNPNMFAPPGQQQEPTTYATGNSFYNNTSSNCAGFESWEGIGGAYGSAHIWCVGQQGLEIYGNTMTQNQRADWRNGWLIKGTDFTKGVKIYNNTLIKKGYPATSPGQPSPVSGHFSGTYWDFAIEFGDEQGLEIYNNIIEGSIDINRQVKGIYAFSASITGNTIGSTSPNTGYENGIIFEYATDTAIVENNTFRNISNAIEFSCRNLSEVKDIRIQRNLAYNIGISGLDGTQGGAVHFISDGSNNTIINNFKCYNNVFEALVNDKPFYGFSFSNIGSGVGIEIINNHIANFSEFAIGANNGNPITSINIENNNIIGSGNSNLPRWINNNPSGNTTQNNISSTSTLFDSNYIPQAGSALINAGLNVGLPFFDSNPDIGYYEVGIGGNISPTANAGVNQTITLPTSSVLLSGTASDSDGTIVSTLWTRISGPNTPTIVSASSLSTSVTGLIQGVYVFQLQATDDLGASGTDTVQITVNSLTSAIPIKRRVVIL